MNVKTVKRFSKRTLSALLSMLMVISLFTVCMVGTVTTVSAHDNVGGKTVYFRNDGDWQQVWVSISHDSYHDVSQIMSVINGSNIYKCTLPNDWTWGDRKYITFSETQLANSKASGALSLSGNYYQSTAVGDEDGRLYYPSGNTKTFTIPTATPLDNIDCVLYNYRNDNQVISGTDYGTDSPNGNANHSIQRDWFPNDKYNNVNDQWNNWNSYLENFKTYNTQVSSWFSDSSAGSGIDLGNGKSSVRTDTTINATPLYQGNFRSMSAWGGVAGTAVFMRKPSNEQAGSTGRYGRKDAYFNFLSVANGANRQNGANFENTSTRAVAWGLADPTLKDTDGDNKGDTMTQNGIEIPQFSRAFMDSSYGKITDDNQQKPVQSRYDNLKFPFQSTVTSKGHTKYFYDAALPDNNRYYDSSSTTLKIGSSVYGRNSEGGEGSIIGYYPFNSTNPSDAHKLVNSFGTKFEINFIMPTNHVLDSGTSNEEKLIFEFSGDDDVWVYIDGHLALDLGGQHNKGVGSINLTDRCATYTTGHYNGTYDGAKVQVENAASGESGSKYLSSSTYGDNITYNDTIYFANTDSVLDEMLKKENVSHTLTVFYMERGEFDSNFYMSFLLPVITPDDNELTLKQKVDSSDVNRALRLETMNVANKDIFAAAIGTQHMPAGQSNIISLPIGNNFTRRQNLYVDETEATTTTLIQKKNVGSGTVVNNGNSSDTQYKDIQAYYSWIDESKLLNEFGEETSTNAFVNSGVGIPLQNDLLHTASGILLSYDQSAIFYKQFSTTPTGTASGAGLHIEGSSVLFEFTSGNSDADGIANRAPNEDRKLGDYYTTNLHVQGCSRQVGDTTTTDFYLHSGGNLYIKENKSYLTYTHKIQTGSFAVEKKLETGETDNDTEYTFKIEYKNLFGIETFINGDTSWHDAKYLLGKYHKKDGTIDNDFPLGQDGTIGLKAGEKIEFSGIPVFTQIRITESPTKKNGSTDEEARVTKVIRQDNLKTYQDTSVNSSTGELTHTFTTSDNGDGESDNTLSTRTESDGVYSSVLLRAEDTNTNKGIKWESDYHYTFYNSYAETPIIYRYHDRNVVNGKPTTLQTGYTYFAKTVPGAVSTFTDSKGVVTTQAKKDIGKMSPQIINVLSTYRLDDTHGSFYHVEVTKEVSGYTFESKESKDGSGFTYTSNTDDVAFNETMQSVFEGKTVGTKIEMIVAEYQNSTRYYDFTVEYIKLDGTSGNYTSYAASDTFHKEFNDTVDLGTALAGGDAGLSGESLKNEHYKINVGTEDSPHYIYFAYWEREVTYRNGDEVVTSYVPVSTNYNYNYKITQDVHIRAVYKDGAKRYVPGANYDDEPDYVHYASDKGWDNKVEENYPGEAHKKTYIRYWKQPAGTTEETDRMYTNDPAQAAAGTYPYTYAQANATNWQWYQLSDEVIGLNGYCLPNDQGQMGYAAAATDRMYNSYSKEIVKEVSGTNVYSKQDRTRVDITFGSVGSYDNDGACDNDGAIQNVGYVLFQNDGSYPVLSSDKITKGKVETIVTHYVKDLPNLIDNTSGSINYAVDGTTNGTSYTCLIGKFTVASTAQYVSPNYTAQNIGYVNLTNKNRADIVFDIKNTASSRNKYYTCYTYMIRNNTVYVSPQPTTFSLSEADPSLKNPDGKKAYIINTKSYLCETDNNNVITNRTTNTSSPYGNMRCNFTTTIEGKDLTFTSETGVYNDGTANYKGELVQLEVGNKTTKTIYPASAFSSLHQVLHHFTEANDVNPQDTILNVVAYYKKVLAGAVLTIPTYDTNKMTVIAVINGTDTSLDSNNQVVVPFGATLSVKAVLNTGYQWQATQAGTMNYTLNGSDYVLDYANGEATDTTKVLDGISSDTTLTNFFANIPEAEEILYNLTIDTGNTASVTGATITATELTTITSPTISGNTIKVPHSYAKANCIVTIETTNATGYKSDDNSSNITWTNATTPVGGSYKKATYTFSSCADVTNVSVRYTADTITIYFNATNDGQTLIGSNDLVVEYWISGVTTSNQYVKMSNYSSNYYSASIPSNISGFKFDIMNGTPYADNKRVKYSGDMDTTKRYFKYTGQNAGNLDMYVQPTDAW